MIRSIFTHTIPFPHLSQTGSFCRFPVGGAGLVVGAFTVRVTMGRVPAHRRKKPLRKTHTHTQLCLIGEHTWKQNTRGICVGTLEEQRRGLMNREWHSVFGFKCTSQLQVMCPLLYYRRKCTEKCFCVDVLCSFSVRVLRNNKGNTLVFEWHTQTCIISDMSQH